MTKVLQSMRRSQWAWSLRSVYWRCCCQRRVARLLLLRWLWFWQRKCLGKHPRFSWSSFSTRFQHCFEKFRNESLSFEILREHDASQSRRRDSSGCSRGGGVDSLYRTRSRWCCSDVAALLSSVSVSSCLGWIGWGRGWIAGKKKMVAVWVWFSKWWLVRLRVHGK